MLSTSRGGKPDWVRAPVSFRNVLRQVNFPEPTTPRERGHLLTERLLRGVEHCLRPGGRLVIVTDDVVVCHGTVVQLGRLRRAGGRLRHAGTGANGSGPAYATDVPAGFGGSFFDRLWASRGFGSRFYLDYVKE